MDSQFQWTILIIEDDQITANLIQKHVNRAGYHTRIAGSGKVALEIINEHKKPLLLLVDYTLPDMDARKLILQVNSDKKKFPFIAISANYRAQVVLEMVKLGALEYIIKEDGFVDLIVPAIEKAITQIETKKKLQRSQRELQENEKLLRQIAENYPNSSLSIIEKDLKVGFSSGQEFKKQNLDPESFYGLTIEEIFRESAAQVKENYLKSFNGEATSFELFFNEQSLLFHTVPLHNEKGEIARILVIAENISERKQMERHLHKINRALRVLGESTRVIVNATEEYVLLKEICQLIVDIGGYRLAWIGFSEHNIEKSVRLAAQAGFEKGYLEKLNITWADTERGRGPTGKAIRTGEPAISQDIQNNPDFIPWREDALKWGYASSAALPLKFQQTIIGALNIYSEEKDAFDEEELDLLGKLTDNICSGIDKLRTRAKRKQAEEGLLNEKKKLDNIVKGIGAGLLLLDLEIKIVWANDIMQSWLGSLDSIKGQLCRLCYLDNLKDNHKCSALRALKSGETEIGVVLRYTYKNKLKNFQPVSVPIKDKNGKIVQIVELLQDISTLKQNEERIENLLGRLMQSQDQERQRISQELHDGVGQTILAAKINLQSHHSSPEEYPDSYGRGMEFIDEASDELRVIYNNLHPSLLKDLGLKSAIQWLAENYLNIKKISHNLQIKLPENIAAEINFSLYRIIQEAFSNIVKYSGAKNVNINIKRSNGKICMKIEDDGKGFNMDFREKFFKGFGLENMRFRIEQLKGDFQIYSEQGKGTKIKIDIPYNPDQLTDIHGYLNNE